MINWRRDHKVHPVLVFVALTSALVFASLLPADSPEPWVTNPVHPIYFAVRVVDVDRAVTWYATALGVELLDDTSAPDGAWRIVNLSGGGLFIEVIRDGRATRATRPLGLAKVGFEVADVEAVAEGVEKSTGERPRIVEDERHGIQLLQLKDPEGNVLQLSSPLHHEG